jgi:L-threonylcarbamoyladenylate synthase
MKVLTTKDLLATPALYAEAAEILRNDGIVIFPGKSSYRLAVNVLSADAVARLSQSKRRVRNAPALVFIPERRALRLLVDHVPRLAEDLMAYFWPGPLTLRFEPGQGVPSKVQKTIAKATGRIGVRLPVGEVSSGLLRAFDGPLLVSSANRASKVGAQSVAQVRKNFGAVADLFIDAGDLPVGEPSTIVDVFEDGWRMVRESVPTEAEITSRLGQGPQP